MAKITGQNDFYGRTVRAGKLRSKQRFDSVKKDIERMLAELKKGVAAFQRMREQVEPTAQQQKGR